MSGERGARRIRLAGFAIAANIVSKLLGFAVIIFSTRVALEHLGTDRFGVWVTISTTATLLGFMDLGVSNALIGRVATLSAGGSVDTKLPSIVSAGLITLIAIGILAAAILASVFAIAPLSAWFKGISHVVVGEARLTGYVFALAFGLSLPAQGVFKIYAGIQRGWVAHLTSAFGWVMSLLLIWLAPRLNAPMWFYLFATYGVQQLVGACLSAGLARRGLLARPQGIISGAMVLKGDALLKQGQMFFIIQIAFAIGWGANQFILSSMIGPAESAQFSVLQRLFMIVQVPLTIINLPLWAMYADAYAENEVAFIRSLLKRSIAITLACSIAGVVLLIGAQRPVVGLISARTLSLSGSSVSIMAIWIIVEACGIAFSMYLNGVGRIRPQAITGVVHTIASLPVKILAVRYSGLNGLLFAIIFSYVAFVAAPFFTIFRSECLDPISGE